MLRSTSGIAKARVVPLQLHHMSSVAEQLRTAREAHNLTVQQVAETTKIRTDHIRALEEGNFNVFSAPVYIRGSVRSYASYVKLDVPQVMAALDTELSATKDFSEPPPLTKRPNGIVNFLTLQLSKVNWRRSVNVLVTLLVLAGIIVIVSVWLHSRHSDPLHDLPPAVYKSAKPDAGEVLPLPSAPGRAK